MQLSGTRDDPTVTRDGNRLPSPIAGVEIERLVIHGDHRGQLVAALDTRRPFWREPVVYAYEFTIRPGRIKGWAMHEHQTDRYFVASADVRVVLYDGRTDAPSHGAIDVVSFSRATPGLVRIPPGVWHADQNWGTTE
ncbi:MAG: hypothetical protein ACRDNY_02130, partial [Gaiellaceae bacterium]